MGRPGRQLPATQRIHPASVIVQRQKRVSARRKTYEFS
jgi:hypothetical protein